MCVVNKQFELSPFMLTCSMMRSFHDRFTAGPVCLCGVSSLVVVLGLFVRLS